MRVVFVATVVLVAALAGCSGKKDDKDFHVDCPDGTELHSEDFTDVNTTADLLKKCSGSSSSGSRSSTSTATGPNVLPVLTLTVTDDGGNATNVTMVNGNLTFSAAGSKDPDGNITGIAVSVKDSNTTRTGTLFDAATKTFKSATFKFDRQGVVNVTIAMVDDRAGFNVSTSKVYVNSLQVLTPGTIQVPIAASESDPCDPTVGDDLLNANMYKRPTFQVAPNASFVTAKLTGGAGEIGVCSPPDTPDGYGTLISNTGTDVITNADHVFVMPPATLNYGVGVFGSSPNTTPIIEVVVHYEPRPAA